MPQDLLGLRARQESGLLVRQGLQALVLQVRQAHKAQQAPQALQELVQLVQLAQQGQVVPQGLRVQQDLPAQQVP